MEIKLPEVVEFIINTLYKNEFEAFIVGGCVRDGIIGVKANDYDITTNAKPFDVIEIFKNYKIIDNGLKHGTVGIIINNEIYEITTYRLEGEYENNRRPKSIEFTSDLLKDLKRRDFTINSMAYNNKEGLIDPFAGKIDIKNKIIRTVGNPNKRFNEDGLRIIRAIRFSAVLGFDIGEETIKSIYKNAYIIGKISKERITDEINKIILSERPQKLILLYQLNIFRYLDIFYDIKDNDEYEVNNYLNIIKDCKFNIEDRLLMIEFILLEYKTNKISLLYKEKLKFYNDNLRAKSIVNKLRYPKSVIKYVNEMMEFIIIDENFISRIHLKKIMSRIGYKNLINILNLKIIYLSFELKINNRNYEAYDRIRKLHYGIDLIKDINKNNECYNIKNLDINGQIIKDIGYSGKEIGQKLEFLLQEVIKNPTLNKRDCLINTLKVKNDI